MAEEIKPMVENYEENKQAKWVEFCKKHEQRISKLSAVNGKKEIPATWHPMLQEWLWVNREQRRKLR